MSSIEICQFCNSSLKDKYALKSHLLKNKNCLKTRGLSLQTKLKEEINLHPLACE